MTPLTAETVIAIASAVRIELRDGTAWVSAGGTSLDAGLHGLTVLDLFRTPQGMAQAMAQLAKRDPDPKTWMQASATIYRLWEAGVLQDADASSAPPRAAKPVAQSAVHTQVRMLADRTRTQGFLRAIRATVKPGDVVLDIGTGTGVLAIAAAQSGAKHVYAMEMTGMAEVAEAMFAANGVVDRVTLLRGHSASLELPEKANVLVTEIIGDGPLGERILESVADARRRLLTPDARIIPAAITLGVVPLRLPSDLLDRYIFTTRNVEGWKQDYQIDFAATQRAGEPGDLTTYRLRPADYLRCEVLAPPAALTRIDFASFSGVSVEASTQIKVEKAGSLHGVAMYFDLEIGAGERLSTAPLGPLAMSADNHWRIPLSLRLQPLEVEAGEALKVDFAYSSGSARLEVKRNVSR